ncbi:hypothetical protein PENCOP_c013G06452 [Penicillium coprophilum]|uniref:Uncharacterized protein n=1 Tax=Penicillium coprophilum TaxID=36646 RepID=A0A1V6UAF2_9EURO|nr:hypothetical protein PENCOP_c013G06452 [Penicillium coprophilum]
MRSIRYCDDMMMPPVTQLYKSLLLLLMPARSSSITQSILLRTPLLPPITQFIPHYSSWVAAADLTVTALAVPRAALAATSATARVAESNLFLELDSKYDHTLVQVDDEYGDDVMRPRRF